MISAIRLGKRIAGWLDGPEDRAGVLPPSVAAARALVDRHRLAALLPYESFDGGTGLFWNEDGIGFLLTGAPATGFDEAALSVLSGLFRQGLKKDTTVQVSLLASPDVLPWLERWSEARRRAIFEGLSQRRVAYLRTGNWRSLLSGQPLLLRDFRLAVAVQRPLPETGAADSPEAEHLQRLRNACLETLSAAGVALSPAGPDELLDLLDLLLNPPRDRRQRPVWDPDGPPLRDQAVSPETALGVDRDGLVLEHDGFAVDVRPLSVRTFPRHWAGWGMNNLIGDRYSDTLRIPCPFLHTLTVQVLDPTAAASGAKFRSARATQMADSPMGRFVPAWAERKREWEFVCKLQEDGHRMLRLAFQTVLMAPRGEGDFAEQRVKSVFEVAGWRLASDRYVALPAWLAALPLAAGPARLRELGSLGRLRSALSWTAVNTLPATAEWKGTGSPLLMLVGRRGQIQHIDPFDNDRGNYNVAVAAASGAGKSFLTQELLTGVLGTGGRAWVIDVGRSYENLCRLIGGTFLEFSPEQGPVLNPFTRVQAIDEAMPLLKRVVAQMATGFGKPLDSLQMACLEQAIARAWADHGPGATITRVAEALAAEGQDTARFLARMLLPYTAEGMHGRFFEGAANVDLDHPFVVLELGELDRKPDLRAVVLMLLMLDITEVMYLSERSQRKLCVIDEAWKLMRGGHAGEFIEEGYRTARKYGGAFMTVTQGINDYYQDAAAQAALDNSDWIFLLRQKKESLAAASRGERIMMDDGLRRLLESVDTRQGQYSEIAVLGPGGVSVGRLLVDPFSEKLYSTNAAEFQALRDLQAQGLSLVEAVERLAQGGGGRR